MKRLAFVIVVLALTTAAWGKPSRAPGSDSSLASFRYLESRRAEVKVGDHGTNVIWRVDADALASRAAWHDMGPPPPQLRGRNDLVCTDDIAWVALAYLKQVEVGRGNVGRARDEAKKALKTLLALQRADGGFVAYQTAASPGEAVSVYNASDWMATARAIQAMGAGVRVLANDGGLSSALQGGLELTVQRVQSFWTRQGSNVGRHNIIDQMRLPAWLPYQRADAAAAVVLGFSDWYITKRADAALGVLRAFADGLVEMQRGSVSQYPWNAFLPQADKPSLWYADGNVQAAALIRAREALQKPTYLSAATAEIEGFYPRLLAAYGSVWQLTPIPMVSPRVPGTGAALAMNANALHRFTGKDRYATMAALFTSWIVVPGLQGGALYDAASGRCADAVPAVGGTLTYSPGASARALYALLDLSDTPAGQQVPAITEDHDAAPEVLAACDGRPVSEPIARQDINPPGGPRTLARVVRDNAFWLRFEVKRTSSYCIDLIYLKDRTSGAILQLRLDGDAILSLPLGATEDEPQLTRVMAIGPSRLEPGLHTLGVKGNGLALSSGTLLDAFIIQPVLAWRVWRLPDGHHVGVFANQGADPQTCDLPAALALAAKTRSVHLLRSAVLGESGSRDEPISPTRRSDGSWQVRVPTLASGMVEW